MIGIGVAGLLQGLFGLGEAAITAWAGVNIAQYAFYGLVVTAAVQLFGMVKDYLAPLFTAIAKGLARIVDLVVQLVDNVFQKILGWFKGNNLRPNVDVPFISTDKNIGQYVGNKRDIAGYADEFESGRVVFTGVYDQQTGKVRNGKVVEIDYCDAETNNVIEATKTGNRYVVLTQ